ncbi:unnamed protein product [Dicrocoelium dendriticum]|nr:unnamed protein product [Dicrocoelium dendriticum]
MMAGKIFSPSQVRSPFRNSLSVLMSSSDLSTEVHPDTAPALLHGLPACFVHGNPRFSPTLLGLNGPDDRVRSKTVDSYSRISMEVPMNLGCLHSSAVEGELQDVPLDSLNSPEVTLPNTLSPMTSPSFCRTLSAPSSCTLESRFSLIRSRTHVKHSSSTANEHCSDITTSDRHNKTSLNLPSLEDGLSSGSDTENLGDLSDTWPPVRTGVVSSCTPTSLKSASLIPPTSVAADFSRGSLVHPPVVQDIWGIMNELKQTLADDHANLNKPVYAPGTHPNCSRSACNDRSSGSTSADFKVPQRSSQPEASYSSPSTATNGSTLSDRGTCSKLIVQASVEHTLEEPPSVRSLGHSDLKAIHPTVSRQTYPTFPSPPTERSAHQWSFPIHSNTVYSSSEDELRTNVSEPGCKPVDVKQQRTLRELASGRVFSTPVSNPRAVTSINTTPTGLLCANRPRSMLPNHLASRRDGNPVTVFRSSYAEHSVHSEEFDSDEDTDQLLERQYQSNKSVYIPELKHEANAQAERRHQMREVQKIRVPPKMRCAAMESTNRCSTVVVLYLILPAANTRP